ncbi:THUMP-like domain-containing protein [Pedobacter sp. AW1-32]|uniref:THUMP-like domain-containing protein n=1 Tax=Pedobacter sp. AW1-32 TaxID=3383026 RepID=UPI003FEDC91F
MNKNLLAKVVQDYICANIHADINQIALAKSPFEQVSPAELATQLLSKKKSEKKLPTWFNTENIYYPQTLSIEQTSSESTARYKSTLARGESLIDLTGGFGVDSFYFSKRIKSVLHCEINAALSEIAAYNAKILQACELEFYSGDGLDYLLRGHKTFDTIYIDPARRSEKGKVFMLKDCTPNVVENLDFLCASAARILIKTAPLLDIKLGLSELKNVSEIHIVSVKNECKELLWVIDRDYNGPVKIKAVTLNDIEKTFEFILDDESAEPTWTNDLLPGQFLYEPDAALLKSGGFNWIAERFALQKLHPQTHLYTSANVQVDFPGRIFEIEDVYFGAALKKARNLRGNVIVRNYPAKPEELVKKHKIESSKEEFLIFSKRYSGEHVAVRAKILQHY